MEIQQTGKQITKCLHVDDQQSNSGWLSCLSYFPRLRGDIFQKRGRGRPAGPDPAGSPASHIMSLFVKCHHNTNLAK